MKKYEELNLVTFNNKYVELLKAYEHLPSPKDGWNTYMSVFKNHYAGSFEKIEDLKTQELIITQKHSIILDGNEWFYYSVKNAHTSDKLNIVMIPEFFEETYMPEHNLGGEFELFRITVNNSLDIDEVIEAPFNVEIQQKAYPYEYKAYNSASAINNQVEDPNYKKINIPEFKLKPFKFKIMNDRYNDLILKYGFKFYDNYALILEGNIFKKIKVYSWLNELTREECIKHFAKIKIKDYTKSAEIFGYKPSKKEMFESNTLFKINSILFDYESKKTHTKLDVIELDNGVKSLKFILDELEFVFTEPKGFSAPSKINITKIRKKDVQGKSVRIIRDKGLPVKKNDKAVLVDMWNNHQPLTGSRYNKREVSWDKDTKVLIRLENNKTIICKLKNIKFVK